MHGSDPFRWTSFPAGISFYSVCTEVSTFSNRSDISFVKIEREVSGRLVGGDEGYVLQPALQPVLQPGYGPEITTAICDMKPVPQTTEKKREATSQTF